MSHHVRMGAEDLKWLILMCLLFKGMLMSSYTIVNTSYLNVNGHKECSTADCVSVCMLIIKVCVKVVHSHLCKNP